MSNFFSAFWAKSDGKTTLEMHTRHVIQAGENLIQNLPFSDHEKHYWKEKLSGVLFCMIWAKSILNFKDD